ncbi:Rieske (2Fe-2S) protein [Sulfitobacter geojensis]|uniref:Rieske (2Fe-2S) protein n=1 Tax=Sulfitobacter geojensis TaxID=1342299 RepID=UPI00046912BE|nr:Rieske (2Fe-2S) protein [Sulfitobacter geojensis]NYI29862.1 3-phenylpropionate/trans-cinnamate dioxygenase ferredoxin subunit [Sulfitobacter geojensis]
MPRVVVAKTADIPLNGQKLVSARGRPIVIYNLDGEWFAMSNKCPHQGGDLCQGRRVGLLESERPGEYRYSRQNEIVRCPWHGWEFDIRTGESICEPDTIKVRRYSVNSEKASELEEGLTVETFEVSVEDELLVLIM